MKINKIAIVKFKETPHKEYHFKTRFSHFVGDLVVVDTIHGYSLATIVGFLNESQKATKWVVDTIDILSHKHILEREKRVKEVKRKMKARKDLLQDVKIYEYLAREDAEMANLIQELNDLKY